MRELTKAELVVLINRFDSISIAVHGPSVAHISLIGSEEDVLMLDAYLMRKHEKKSSQESMKERIPEEPKK